MRLKVSFEGIEVKPDDTVVIRPNELIIQHEAQKLYEVSKKAFPNNNVVILLPGYSIKTYNKKEFLEFLESLKKMVEGSKTE